jgi:hypothetical protein
LNKLSRGFSLVETLATTAIVVTVVASLATLFSQVKKQSQMMDRLRDVNTLHLRIINLLTQTSACNQTLFASQGVAAPFDYNFTNATAVTVGLANGDLVPQIFNGRNPPAVAFRTSMIVNDQAVRGVEIVNMQISNFGPNNGLVADGQQFFFLDITYQLSANQLFTALDYQITRSIPIFLLWGDDPSTDPPAIENNFLGCTSNAHRGINRAYMNVNLPDVAIDNTDYDGGIYDGATPVPAPIIGPSTPDPIPGLTFTDELMVYAHPIPNDGLNAGYVQARNFFSLSDEKEKSNIKTLPNSLELLNKINVYEYHLKGRKNKEIGFLAQELEPLTPLVKSRLDGLKAVSYSGVVALQVEAIKELKKKQDSIKIEMQNLKKELLEMQKSR